VFTRVGLQPPTDQILDQTVVAGRGSARSIFSDVVLSANRRIRNGEAANDSHTDQGGPDDSQKRSSKRRTSAEQAKED
jgi:hypothetical protein